MAGDITSIIQSIGNISSQISVQLVMGYLDTVPFLNLPIINQITEFLVAHFIDLIVNKLELFTINLITIIETSGQESDFVKAAQANAIAMQGSDANAQAKAQADLIASARKFFKLTPP